MATIDGDSGDNILTGGLEDDLIRGFEGQDELIGGAGDDTLIGGAGEDYLRGGRGNDTFNGYVAGASLGEADRVFYHLDRILTQGVDVDLAGGTGTDGWGFTDSFEDISRVTGSYLDDVIRGNDLKNSFSGYEGDDTLDGRGGYDVVRYANASEGVTVDLQAGTATGADGNDTLIDIEGVTGSNFSDEIYGSDRTDVVEWFYLDDFGNEDTPNYLVEADDLLDGRGGQDGVAYDNNTGRVVIHLQRDRAIDASGHTDTLLNVEHARGSQADDRIVGADAEANRLFGSGGDDFIRGKSGQDYLNGSFGQDSLQGGLGRDTLFGGSGNDKLLGGRGGDSLEGGRGADDFVFKRIGDSGPSTGGRDHIVDFDKGQDRIVLSAIDAMAGPRHAGNQAFVLDQGGSFDAGEIRQVRTDDGLVLKINRDRDSRAELSIVLDGFSGTLTASDFDL